LQSLGEQFSYLPDVSVGDMLPIAKNDSITADTRAVSLRTNKVIQVDCSYIRIRTSQALEYVKDLLMLRKNAFFDTFSGQSKGQARLLP